MRNIRHTRLNRIRNSVKDYFTFTRSERNGIAALVVILVLLMGTLYYSNFITPPKTNLDIVSFKREIKSFEASLTPKKESVFAYLDSADKKFYSEELGHTELFAFNPNDLPEDDWKKLGVPVWLITRIKNYESKGGHFNRKEDLLKIYSMPLALYQKLEPYIDIKDAGAIQSKSQYASTVAEVKNEDHSQNIIDLNLATESELDALPLIGSTRAKAIISYREKLRGYAFKEQLLEVWCLNDTVFNAIAHLVEVKAKYIQPISINVADPKLLRHPYINYQLAKMVVNYRTTHGDYQTVEEVKKLPLVSADLYAKLAPYLTVN